MDGPVSGFEQQRAFQAQFTILGERVSRLEAFARQVELGKLRTELAEVGKELTALRQMIERVEQETTISRSLGGYGERLIAVLADLVAGRLNKN